MVHTELFDEDWTGGETVVTTRLSEREGKTTLTRTVLHASKAGRDAALASGMTKGVDESFVRLDEVLTTIRLPMREWAAAPGTPAPPIAWELMAAAAAAAAPRSRVPG